MMATPIEDEIKCLVKAPPKDKLSGIDKVIVKVLNKFWDVMKPACVAMVHAYWRDGTLTSRAIARVIKLVPKNLKAIRLLNWRPLTMLTLMEKFCAKLVANRIKGPTNKRINAQQTNFLLGRNITDNLLTYKIVRELVTKKKQEAVMLKADFMKVYNRVEHVFI